MHPSERFGAQCKMEANLCNHQKDLGLTANLANLCNHQKDLGLTANLANLCNHQKDLGLTANLANLCNHQKDLGLNANLANLCNHQKDLGLNANLANFFATSLGKQPCDGIGRTVKRIGSKESFQRLSNKSFPQNLFESAIEDIKFILVEKEEVEEMRRGLTMRFENASRVPRTKSFHQFILLAKDKIAMKQCSKDKNYDQTYDFSIEVEHFFFASGYVCCQCDNKIWIGMVLEINMENNDLLIKFIHPSLPSHSFYWKEDFKDICFVPLTNILCTVDVPATVNGRVYHLSKMNKLSLQKIIYKTI